jgi:hypothetical protein
MWNGIAARPNTFPFPAKPPPRQQRKSTKILPSPPFVVSQRLCRTLRQSGGVFLHAHLNTAVTIDPLFNLLFHTSLHMCPRRRRRTLDVNS